MKKIALFSDGTSNSASNLQKTHVWRAYQLLDTSASSNQIAFYDNGVGTSSFTPTALLGLAFGWGLARNVKQIYGFLCRAYDPGDEIYGFGFSRGAFTMRVVMALIASEGIIDKNQVKEEGDMDRLVEAAYDRYRRENFDPSLISFFLRSVNRGIAALWNGCLRRKSYDPRRNIGYSEEPVKDGLIKFIGVWDTVDAYGLPIDELTRAWDKVIWPLTAKDHDLSPRVARACHALALDEQRESFEPMLWNEAESDERISQVWFPGVHANVGGGYPDDALGYAALDWILFESEKNDGLSYLKQERKHYQDHADTNGPIYDSRAGIGNLYRYAPRSLERLYGQKRMGLWRWCQTKMGKAQVANTEGAPSVPKVHRSVFDRIIEGGDAYAPINLPERYQVVNSTGEIVTGESDSGGVFETAQQAGERKASQNYVWNKVWGRKLLYFMSLAAILAFVFFPNFAEDDSEARERFAAFVEPFVGTFGFIIRAIPEMIGKVPGLGFAETWATSYAGYPFVFFFGLLGIGGLWLWSNKVNAALKGEMRRNWCHLTTRGTHANAEVSPFRKNLARFLCGPEYRNNIERPIRIGLEIAAILVLTLLLLAACSRLFVVVSDGFGKVCTADPSAKVIDPGAPVSLNFNPKNPCFATGLVLRKGEEYLITFSVSEDWRDADIDADARGWAPDSSSGIAPLAAPIRRHLFADWYQPIARIGNKLFDHYPLVNTEGMDTDAVNTHRKLAMRFKARRSGELYLYLNDAVFFSPYLPSPLEYYSNNNGSATVTVGRAD